MCNIAAVYGVYKLTRHLFESPHSLHLADGKWRARRNWGMLDWFKMEQLMALPKNIGIRNGPVSTSYDTG